MGLGSEGVRFALTPGPSPSRALVGRGLSVGLGEGGVSMVISWVSVWQD